MIGFLNQAQVKEFMFFCMLKLNMVYSLLQEVSSSFTTWQSHSLFLIRFPDPRDVQGRLSASFELADIWECMQGK